MFIRTQKLLLAGMLVALVYPSTIIEADSTSVTYTTVTGHVVDPIANLIHQGKFTEAIDQIGKASKKDIIGYRNKDKETYLHLASWFGRTDVADKLVQKGLGVDTTGFKGETAIFTVIQNQKLEPAKQMAMVTWLVDHRAKVNAKDAMGLNPLFWASALKNEPLKKFLLDKGAQPVDVNAADKDTGRTALHKATGMAYLDAVKLLVENGATINAKDTKGMTPLGKAYDSLNYSYSLKKKERFQIRQKQIEQNIKIYQAIIDYLESKGGKK